MVAMYSNRKGSSYHYFGGIKNISMFSVMVVYQFLSLFQIPGRESPDASAATAGGVSLSPFVRPRTLAKGGS